MTTRSLTIATAVALSLGLATVSTAEAGPRNGSGCPKWVCGENGTSLNGLALHGAKGVGGQSAIKAITLPSGETVKLR